MTDLPIINPRDYSKVPQSTKNPGTGVVAFNSMVPYFFKYDTTYKANDVFFVDNDLGLTPIEIARTAADNHIPTDIKYTGTTVTTTTDPTTPAASVTLAGTNRRQQSEKNIVATTAASVVPVASAGGISWIGVAVGGSTASGDHVRAFDAGNAGNHTAPMIAGVQGFTGGNGSGAGFTNVYYLGASIADHPLYSASMCFRALGYKRSGLAIAVTPGSNNAFLQIASGEIDSWYSDTVRVPQRSKAGFYYTHGQTVLNSPVLVLTQDALHRKDVNGVLTPFTGAEYGYHFVYLDPTTLNIYIALWSPPAGTVANAANSNTIALAIDAHSNTTIPNFLRENGILLGVLVLRGGQSLVALTIFQLHDFIPGNGSALHPGVPSPGDAPYGGTLKAKNNVFELDFDYDSYLINKATLLKNNYLFVYDTKTPRNISVSGYETTRVPLINLISLGGFAISDSSDRALEFLYFSIADRATYPDINEKGNYRGAKYFHSPTSENIQIAEIKGGATIEYLIPTPSDLTKQYPIFRNTVQLVRALSVAEGGGAYTTLLGSVKIPGLNDYTQTIDGQHIYSDAFRSSRSLHGSADSVIVVQALIPNAVIRPELYIWKYITDDARDLITKLTTLIGASLVTQIKTMFEAVKKAGLLCDQGRSILPIIGYTIQNASTITRTEYALLGSLGLHYNGVTGQITIDPAYPITIQPADVVTLTSGDLSPLQAVFFFLVVRYNYMAYVGTIGDGTGSNKFQVTETAMF